MSVLLLLACLVVGRGSWASSSLSSSSRCCWWSSLAAGEDRRRERDREVLFLWALFDQEDLIIQVVYPNHFVFSFVVKTRGGFCLLLSSLLNTHYCSECLLACLCAPNTPTTRRNEEEEGTRRTNKDQRSLLLSWYLNTQTLLARQIFTLDLQGPWWNADNPLRKSQVK